MHAGAQAKLPAMIVVFGLPVDGECGTYVAVGVERGKPIEDQPARDAVRAAPRVARDLNAQRAAVMRPRSSPGADATQD